jgi:alanine racemase
LDGRVPGIRRRALIDLDAFGRQVADAAWDARADAYGHGLALLAPVARAAGVREVVVSDDRDAGVAREAGFAPDAIRVDRRGTDADSSAYGFVTGSPIMTLVGELIALKRVDAGAGVSYGYTYRTGAPTTLALVALGYADGVPRGASNRAQVAVGGALFPLVGRIAMDQLVLDVGEAKLELGADAVLWGDAARNEPTALDWGAWTTRDPWTLTAGLARRIARVAR